MVAQRVDLDYLKVKISLTTDAGLMRPVQIDWRSSIVVNTTVLFISTSLRQGFTKIGESSVDNAEAAEVECR